MSQQQPPPGYGPPPGYAYQPQPPPKPRMSLLAKVLIGIGVVTVGMFGACATCAVIGAKGVADAQNGAPQGAVAAASPQEVAAVSNVELSELLSEYKDNEVRADAAYKGKRVRVTGQVDSIKKDIVAYAPLSITPGTPAGPC